MSNVMFQMGCSVTWLWPTVVDTITRFLCIPLHSMWLASLLFLSNNSCLPSCLLSCLPPSFQSRVQAELQRRLDKERPRNHLDMRHRLDKDGRRYGKVIDYK